MTPKDPSFGGDFLGQILAAPSLPGTSVYSREMLRHAFGAQKRSGVSTIFL